MLEAKGVATLAVMIVVVATAGGVSTPVVMDQIDTLPDSPFYGLERIGEGIKETVMGGQGFDISLADERVQEFTAMVDRGKALKYTGLVDEAQDRIGLAVEKITDNTKFERALEAVKCHLAILECLREEVQEEAKVELSLALYRSTRAVEVLSDLKAGVISKDQIKERIQIVKQSMEQLREQVAILPVWQAVQTVDVEACDHLLDRLEAVADQLDSDTCGDVAEILENRLDGVVTGVENEQGIERAKEAVMKHIAVLENIYEKVPEQAKPAIALAIARSARAVEVLTLVETGEIPIPQIKESVQEVKQAMKELRDQVWENIEKGVPVIQAVSNLDLDISETLIKKIENLAAKLTDTTLPRVAQHMLNRYTRHVTSVEQLQKVIQLTQQYLSAAENASVDLTPISEWLENCSAEMENIMSEYEAGNISDLSEKMNELAEHTKTQITQTWQRMYGG